MNRKSLTILVLLVLSVIATAMYSIARIVLFLTMDIPWVDRTFAGLLLCAELFVFVHSIGYLFNVLHVTLVDGKKPTPPPLKTFPPVAVVLASYKEPLEIIEDTLTCFYNLTYPNKHLFLLDDTRYEKAWDTPENVQKYKVAVENLCKLYEVNLIRHAWHDAKAGMINDFLDFLQGNPKEGFECHRFDGRTNQEQIKYLIVFDADMNPTPNFIEPLVEIMESDPKMAFIQTPQYYSNFETNRVARASGLMQAVFYEFICEAKGLENAMICCGTNVIFRLEALYEVGGFDHTSVTEDFATSFLIHGKQWKSNYYNRVMAFGMGPEDLGAFFKQQHRWAFGTVGLFRKLLPSFIKNPFSYTINCWWQYFISSTYYFIGWVFFIMALCPIMYLFFNIPFYLINPFNYFLFFVPYIVLSNLLFYLTLSMKRYPIKDIFSGVLIGCITFPVFMQASFSSLLGKKASFVVTPKEGGGSIPLRSFWPQLTLALVSFAAVVWGSLRIYYEQDLIVSLLMNMFWCFYYFVILSSILYFNHPSEKERIMQVC